MQFVTCNYLHFVIDMRASLLTGIQKIELQDVAGPGQVGDTEVLIKVGPVGVCGSDIHYYSEGKIGEQIANYPFRIGHECSGIVEEVGKKVSKVRSGDRVAIDPAVPCQDCDQCRRGRYHTCLNNMFLGCPGQLDGSLAEFIIMPEMCCFPIDESLTLDHATMSEPLSIGYYATQLASVTNQQELKIGILGVGPIGLSVLLCLKAQGHHQISVTDKLDYRLEIARNAGAHWSGNPLDQDMEGEWVEYEPDLLDIVFECCGQQDGLDQGVRMLRPGGKLILIGIPSLDRISFQADSLRRKELSLHNVRRQLDCVQPVLDLIRDGKINPDLMVTHRFKPEQTGEAFHKVSRYEDGVIKAMIDFGP